MKKLIKIVGSSFNEIKDLRKNGNLWFKIFKEEGILREGMKILDYGAGLGRLSVPFSEMAKVVATDPNEKMVEYLESVGIEAYKRKDCRMLKQKDFDFILSAYVFQHIPLELTQRITRQMAKFSNKLYFTFPTYEMFEKLGRDIPINYDRPKEKDEDELNEFGTHDFGSIILNEKELKILFDKSDWNTRTIKQVTDKIENLFEISK